MRWWVALLLSCSALVAAGFATGPFSHSGSHRAAGASAAARASLLDFVARVNRTSPRRAAPPGDCAVAGDGCVRGCVLPVASTTSPAPPADGACAQARAARPCRELIALPQRGSSGFCSSAGPGLQPRKFPHRPRLRR
jgi:hypothetical protein